MPGLTTEQTLKLTQKLSPLQIQTIKLIELPIMELEQKVRRELEDNPVVDDDPTPTEGRDDDDQPKDVSIDELDKDDPIPGYKYQVNNYGKDETPEYNTFSVKQSFSQSLMEQLGFRHLDKRQYQIASFIIGSLDEDGYLRRDIGSIVDDVAFRVGIDTTEDEVLDLLYIIQEFDPAGVGARDLQECLILQLEAKQQTPEVILAAKILSSYFQEFSNKHFSKIITKLGITEEEFKAAMKKILKLNPSPGGQLDDSYNDQAQQIVPDFKLEYVDGEFKLTMPRFNIPEIRMNKKYARLLEESKGSTDKATKEAVSFVKQKMDSAKWFIEALKQRYNTLESTMKAILEYQRDYFVDGDDLKLRPMVLNDIANVTGFDISTISRVVNSKYIETHFGVFPLKYFFSEGLADQSGEEVSTRGLKMALKKLIDEEDKRKPLTDDELVTRMKDLGYKVARRTIAKYRDNLNIPNARLRKDI